jgi:adenosylhomocysteine nucleosidase
MKEEEAPFRKIAAGNPRLRLLRTGIGRRNARKSVEAELARARPGLVLTCGFAGALGPERAIGDVLFESSDPSLSQKLVQAGAKPGKFVCADRVATTAAEKQALRSETGADAVEMESEAIHAVCRERGIPCATVRVISDIASEDLPLDFNRLAKPDQSLDYGKLFRAIARSPGKIGGLLRLQKQTRLAAEKLAAVLMRFTE